MFVINPGTGPVAPYSETEPTETQARENMVALCSDTGSDVASIARHPAGDDNQGRWGYWVRKDGVRFEVAMPGIPLDRVRYVAAPDQNIWHFPRLYINGSSWVWKFAVDAFFER